MNEDVKKAAEKLTKAILNINTQALLPESLLQLCEALAILSAILDEGGEQG